MASGYIAGAALAGILIALSAVYLGIVITSSRFHSLNPFFAGQWSDLLAFVPFIAIALFLYFVGRDRVFGKERPADDA